MLARALIFVLCVVVLLDVRAARAGDTTGAAARDAALVRDSLQLVVVTTASWSSARGSLRRFERASTEEPFRAASRATPVVVGRRGLARAREKREGDVRAPAGVFALRSLFGTQPSNPAWKLPFTRMTKHHRCVDDPRSPEYTHIVDARDFASPPPWKSAEEMRRRDGQYRLGIVVGHNEARRAGDGSCIFLHVWKRRRATRGCTAMAARALSELARWLTPAAKPRLVQLPRAEWKKLRARLIEN